MSGKHDNQSWIESAIRKISPERTFCFIPLVLGVILFVASGNAAVTILCAIWSLVYVTLFAIRNLPVTFFAFSYQFLGVSFAYSIYVLNGRYPGLNVLGDIDRSVLYSAVGLLCAAFGLTLSVRYVQRRQALPNEVDMRLERTLLYIVLISFAPDWIQPIQKNVFGGGLSQVFDSLLAYRDALLLMFLMVAVNRSSWLRLLLVTAYVFFPSATSHMSAFAGVFFYLVIALMSALPSSVGTLLGSRSRYAIAASLFSIVLLMGLVWSGGLKYEWRQRVTSGEVAGGSLERIQQFGDQVQDSVKSFRIDDSIESLASRLGSGQAYFSHVISRVPKWFPHEGGALIWSAIVNVTVPRFLFPDKPVLGSDSWLVRTYAGLNVAGEESGTSVGLGYLAEFYIDFGVAGLLSLPFILGLVFGGIYWLLSYACRHELIVVSMFSILLLSSFSTLDASFAKLFAGLIQKALIFALLGRLTHNYLLRPRNQ